MCDALARPQPKAAKAQDPHRSSFPAGGLRVGATERRPTPYRLSAGATPDLSAARAPILRHDASWPTRTRAGGGRARLPPSRAVGRLRPPRLQLPLGLERGRPGAVPRHRPGPLGPLRREPGPVAGGGLRPAPARGGRRPVAARPAPPRSSRRCAPTWPAPRARACPRPTAPWPTSRAEYGVHVSLPIYSGGLGALAGDILKEASDMALPMVAVGLLYRNGYFRQRIDANGWQHEYWVDTDPDRLPAALVKRDDGTPVTVTVPIRDFEVTAQIWRVDVGRVPLFLLDAERPENSAWRAGSPRACTSRTPTCGSPSTCCWAWAACRRWPRWGSSPRSCTSTRATRRSSRWRWPAAPPAASGNLQGALETAAAAHRLHHPHAGPGRQRHLSGPAGGGDARRRWPAGSA